MRLDEFYLEVQNAGPDVLRFELLLAQVDPTPGDGIEVQLSDIGWIEVDYDAGQVRLYPRSAVTEDKPDELITTLEVLLQALPFGIDDNDGLALMAEIPLDREPRGLIRTVMSEVHALHVGRQSEEAWLLLNPGDSFSNDVLPP